MSRESPRRLTLVSLMLLVGTTAIGLTLGKLQVELDVLRYSVPSWWVMLGLQGAVWLAVALSLSLLVLQLWPPRPRLRRLACRPGFLANVAVAVTLAVLLTEVTENVSFLFLLHHRNPDFGYQFARVGNLLPTSVVHAVAALWTTLFLAGRWRPEDHWIDRSGRLLGWFWLLYPTLFWCVSVLQEFFR